MEAMFDRMDAIGKGVLGLTIQCAQCHTHKYDPLTQEEYYRMFAFLNNTHEANVAVYTPDEQMKRADLFRRIREIEDELQHATSRLARADGRVGSAGRGRSARVGGRRAERRRHQHRRPEASACMRRRLDPGRRATPRRSTRPSSRSRRTLRGITAVPAGAAQRPEPAAGRAGPVDQGDRRADRVRGRGRAGRWLRQDRARSRSSRRRPT